MIAIKYIKRINEQRGVTLIEMLIVIGTLAVIMGAISTAVITMILLGPHSRDWAVALQQTQNAGFWISRDVEMAEIISVETDPKLVTMKWTDWDFSEDPTHIYYTVTYEFEDMDNGLKSLWREYTSTAGADSRIMIAEYVYYNPSDMDKSTVVSLDTALPRTYMARITVQVAASAVKGEDVEVTKEYRASQRPTF